MSVSRLQWHATGENLPLPVEVERKDLQDIQSTASKMYGKDRRR
jgi:uncharacterized protein VirK/YbjX